MATSYLTNFPVANGGKSFGLPIFGSAISKHIFVKPNTGSDEADGLSPDYAVKTLSKALSLATANQNDVVVLIAESNSAGSTSARQTESLAWNKDLVHLVGVSANKYSQRSRITGTSGTAGITPVLDVSANGCVFANFQVYAGVNTDELIAVQVSGERNSFFNVHFAGLGDATLASTANAASLKLTGSENYFKDCVIGLDTIARDGDAKGEIWLDGGATRNWFEDCLVTSYVSDTDHFHVTLEDTTAIDRTLIFKNTVFFSKSTNKAVTQAGVFSIPAGISQGAILLIDSYAASDGGAIDWDANNRGIIWNNSVAAAASAAGGILTNQ